MARTKTPAQPAAEPEYAEYLDKEPTQLMQHIVPWLIENTGVDPSEYTPEEAFELGVHLTVALRPAHQASPENQERLAKNKAAREAADAEREQRRSARPAATETDENPAPKRRGRPPKNTAPVPTEEAEEAPAPKRRGRPPKAKAAAETADNVTPMRRAGRRPATESTDETPARPVARRRGAKVAPPAAGEEAEF